MSYVVSMRKGATLQGSLQDRLQKRIARKRGDVFLRTDFDDLGGYDQVGRALRQLVEKGRLMKVGYGMYARARPSILDGRSMPTKGMRELAVEALGRLGVETAPTRWDEAYASGKSVQVPTGRVIGVRGRVRRKIGYNGVYLKFERAERWARRVASRDRGAATTDSDTATIGVHAALCLIWQADRYPILGNEDVPVSLRLEEEALAKAAQALPASDDPPEFADWLTTLLDPLSRMDEREAVIAALCDFFDPEPNAHEEKARAAVVVEEAD